MKQRARRAFMPALVFFVVAVSLNATQLHAALNRDGETVSLGTEGRLRGALRSGSRAVVAGVNIDGVTQSLELEPFDVFASDAKIHVIGPDGERLVAPPRIRMMRGVISGNLHSRVFLSESAGDLGGIIVDGGRTYILQTTGEGSTRRTALFDAEVVTEGEQGGCDTDRLLTPKHTEGVRSAIANARVVAPSAATVLAKKYGLRLAIDTDNELRSLFGSQSAMVTYIANLIGAVSTIYQADINTTIALGDVFTYEAIADPWAVTAGQGTTLALYELGDYWHANRSGIIRGTVALLSGKDFGGGIGWIGTIGGGDFFCGVGECTSTGSGWGGGYSVNGSLTGVVNTTVKTQNTFWDVLQVAHEIGHNFDSSHTHCIPAAEFGRAFVDFCVNTGGGGCYGGAESTPGELGTIMSYCHIRSGGFTNTRLIFGQGSEPSQAVLPPMTGKVVAVAPVGNASSPVSNVCAGSTGNTASYAGGVGISSYSWSITNGTITGGATASTVTYTAGASGVVTLTVNALGTNGISTIGAVSVDIAANSINTNAASVSALAGNGSINVTSACSWTAVSNTAFITITSGTPGSGNGTVNYSYLANAGAQRVGTITAAGRTFTLTQSALAAGSKKGDFNGDLKTDIVLRNYSTGQNALWLMNGTALSGVVDLPALPNTNYRIEGTADFNNDGKNDIVLRNYATGQDALWLMNGTSLSSIVDLPALPNTNYRFEGTGDFNNDGKPDIILRNYATGQNALWVMNGTSLTTIVDLPALANLNYRIEGAGDFNNDGKVDIVLRNYGTGANALWLMNGTALSSVVDLPALPNLNYRIDAVGDINNDGKPDIVLRNYATGQNAVWLMNGTALSSIADLPALTNLNYQIAGPR